MPLLVDVSVHCLFASFHPTFTMSARVVAVALCAALCLGAAVADDYYSYISLNLQWPASNGCVRNCEAPLCTRC